MSVPLEKNSDDRQPLLTIHDSERVAHAYCTHKGSGGVEKWRQEKLVVKGRSVLLVVEEA